MIRVGTYASVLGDLSLLCVKRLEVNEVLNQKPETYPVSLMNLVDNYQGFVCFHRQMSLSITICVRSDGASI